MATSAPSRAYASATARPMPLSPPVISAARPASRPPTAVAAPGARACPPARPPRPSVALLAVIPLRPHLAFRARPLLLLPAGSALCAAGARVGLLVEPGVLLVLVLHKSLPVA